MKFAYQVNDIVYVVDEFRVIKSVIDSIVVTQDKDGEHLVYVAYPYQQKDEKRKMRQFCEAKLVKNLSVAKQSALANWRMITQKVEKDLNNLTDKDFEAIKNEIK